MIRNFHRSLESGRLLLIDRIPLVAAREIEVVVVKSSTMTQNSDETTVSSSIALSCSEILTAETNQFQILLLNTHISLKCGRILILLMECVLLTAARKIEVIGIKCSVIDTDLTADGN